MYPRLSDTDCWIAEMHYRQLIDEGQWQQRVTELLPRAASTRAVSAAPREQLGQLLVRAGAYFRKVEVATRKSFRRAAAPEPGSVA